MKYKWGKQTYEIYKPKRKKKKVAIIGGLIIGDLILPLTFGAGCIMAKLITKYRPLFLYQ